MGLLNFCVYCTSARRTLLPWKIAECPLPTFTFKQFYEEKVGSEFSDRVLKQVFVGQTKESLDLVDHDLVVAEVLSVFGRYVKYNVEKEAGSEPPQVATYTSYMYKVSEKYVFVRGLRCYEPLEKLYYSVGSYEHICIYCCSSDNISQKQDCYPQCAACGNREVIKRRK